MLVVEELALVLVVLVGVLVGEVSGKLDVVVGLVAQSTFGVVVALDGANIGVDGRSRTFIAESKTEHGSTVVGGLVVGPNVVSSNSDEQTISVGGTVVDEDVVNLGVDGRSRTLIPLTTGILLQTIFGVDVVSFVRVVSSE